MGSGNEGVPLSFRSSCRDSEQHCCIAGQWPTSAFGGRGLTPHSGVLQGGRSGRAQEA